MEEYRRGHCENCLLRQLNSFKALSKEDLKDIADKKIRKFIKKRDVIFHEGEKLNGVFCVISGVAKLSKMSENGKDQVIKIVGKGEVLGQRSVIAQEPTNLSAVAIQDIEVCFIPKKYITKNLNHNIDFTRAMLFQIAEELKIADNEIVNMAHKSVKQRIATTLQYLERNFGTDEDGYISIRLNREEIANMVGTAKEACIRTLTSFRKQGWISTKAKKIKIEDHNALSTLV